MAHAPVSQKPEKKAQASGDFSVIAGTTDSLLKNTSWPRQDDLLHDDIADTTQPLLQSGEFGNGQISASHYALATAYERVSKKLAEAEKRNHQLKQEASLRDQFQVNKMSDSTSYNMPSNLEDSVNQAWEAYNEKCKECQQLREELEEVKQRANNREHFSKIQNLKEDVLREKAKQDDVVRILEKTKMEADHLEKKELLAREELEKEREYQRSIIQSAEKKHNEMEQHIDELERSLANEKSLTEDLRRRENDRAKALEDDFLIKRDGFNSKIRELEELNISLREEVSILVSLQAGNSNGNGSNSRTSFNGPSISFNSMRNEIDVSNMMSLEHEIQSLHMEMSELKKRANEQSLLLSSLCQNPRLRTLINTMHKLPPSKSENCANRQPLMDTTEMDSANQCQHGIGHLGKKMNSDDTNKSLSNHNEDDDSCYPSSSNDLRNLTSNQDGLSKQKHSISNMSENSSSLMPTEDFIRSLAHDGQIKQNHRLLRQSQNSENVQQKTVLDISRVIHTPESGVRLAVPGNSNEDFGLHNNGLATTATVHNEGSTTSKPLANGEKDKRPFSEGMELDSSQFPSATSSSMSSTDTLILIPAARSNAILVADNPSSRRTQATHEIETPSNRYTGSSSDEDNTSDDGFMRVPGNPDDFHPKEFVVPKVVRPSHQASSRKAFQSVGYQSPATQTNTRPSIRARAETSAAEAAHQAIRPRSGCSAATNHHSSSQNEAESDCPVCGEIFTSDWTEMKKSIHINAHFSDDEQNDVLSIE